MINDEHTMQTALQSARDRQSQARNRTAATQAAGDRGAARSELARQRHEQAEHAMADHRSRLAEALQSTLRDGSDEAGAPLATDETLSIELVRAQSELSISETAVAGLESEHADALADLRGADADVADAENAIVSQAILARVAKFNDAIGALLREAGYLGGCLPGIHTPAAVSNRLRTEVQESVQAALSRLDRPLRDRLHIPVNELHGLGAPGPSWAERRAELLAAEAA